MRKLSDYKDDDVVIIDDKEVLVKFLKYQLEYAFGKKPNPDKVFISEYGVIVDG